MQTMTITGVEEKMMDHDNLSAHIQMPLLSKLVLNLNIQCVI